MSLGTSIFCGHLPVGSRQTVLGKCDFDGTPPLFGADVFVPGVYSNGIVTYIKEGDETTFEAQAGGLFTFGNIAVEVTKIFCEADNVNELKLTIADPDGSHEVIVRDWGLVGDYVIDFYPPVTILPDHQFKVYTRSSLLEKTVTVITERAVKKV
jgi:hypothetical protein